ncbi:actinodefensin-associated protein B [Streptomyces hirsutus]|uniref:actinodefensin-associated protein B n=1 Tax=Streptomyces hirsutus TaxID=35620 RepID=UPI003655041E
MTPVHPPRPGTALRLAPGVGLTPLPFGGAVLANGRTLAVSEIGPRDTLIVHRLLAVGMPPQEAGPWPTRFAGHLIEAGWLTAERS